MKAFICKTREAKKNHWTFKYFVGNLQSDLKKKKNVCIISLFKVMLLKPACLLFFFSHRNIIVVVCELETSRKYLWIELCDRRMAMVLLLDFRIDPKNEHFHCSFCCVRRSLVSCQFVSLVHSFVPFRSIPFHAMPCHAMPFHSVS